VHRSGSKVWSYCLGGRTAMCWHCGMPCIRPPIVSFADEDPDKLSFLHTVRVVRRKLPLMAAFPRLIKSQFTTVCSMRSCKNVSYPVADAVIRVAWSGRWATGRLSSWNTPHNKS